MDRHNYDPTNVTASSQVQHDLLQEQQALKGNSTPPEVLIEIEDIGKTVAELQRQLRALRTRAA